MIKLRKVIFSFFLVSFVLTAIPTRFYLTKAFSEAEFSNKTSWFKWGISTNGDSSNQIKQVSNLSRGLDAATIKNLQTDAAANRSVAPNLIQKLQQDFDSGRGINPQALQTLKDDYLAGRAVNMETVKQLKKDFELDLAGVLNPSMDGQNGLNEEIIDYSQKLRKPEFHAPDNLGGYDLTPVDSAQTISDKMNEMIRASADAVDRRSIASSLIDTEALGAITDSVDRMYDENDEMFAGIDAMYDEIDAMYKRLDGNYADLDKYDVITQSVAEDFNAKSDAMADRVGEMIAAVDGITQKTKQDIARIDAMLGALKDLLDDGNGVGNIERLGPYLSEVESKFKKMTDALKQQGANPVGGAEENAKYLKSLKDYDAQLDDAIASKYERVTGIIKYLESAKEYFIKTLKTFNETKKDLENVEQYFRNAKIEADTGGREPGVCGDDMSPTMEECSKKCNTVCKFEKEIEGVKCYKCEQGGEDTCWDVGAWPTDHPWCNGGICDTDPMLYCLPLAATGPNKTPLTCLNCKQRVDLCWQHFQDTTTLTNCKLGCWNGKCEYRGRYDEMEWTGRAEWIHCYECMTPPPAPDCEDLQWGYDFKEDCLDNCPAPGQCVEEKKSVPGGKDDGKKDDEKQGEEDDAQGDNQGGEDGAKNGGEDKGGAASGGGSSGSGSAHAGDGQSDDTSKGSTPNPPTDDPSKAGGGSPSRIAGGQLTEGQNLTDKEPNKAAPRDDQTRAKKPDKPEDKKPDIKETEPPQAPQPPIPVNPEIASMKKRIEGLEDRIKEREKIREEDGYYSMAANTAWEQMQGYKKEIEDLEKKIKEAEEADKKAAEEAKQRAESAARYQAERQKEYDKWDHRPISEQIKDLQRKEMAEKKAVLETRVKNIQEHMSARADQVNKLGEQVAEAEKQAKAAEKAAQEAKGLGGYESVKRAEADKAKKKLQGLRAEYDPMKAAYERDKASFDREIEKKQHEIDKLTWATDDEAHQKEEAKRIDEYSEMNSRLRRIEESQEISNKKFDEKIEVLEKDLVQAKKEVTEGLGGLSTKQKNKVEQLEREIANVRRGKKDYNDLFERRKKQVNDELHDADYNNLMDGVGPTSAESLGKQLDEHQSIVKKKIEDKQAEIDQLKTAIKDGQLKPGAEKVAGPLLNRLESELAGLNTELAGLEDKKRVFDSKSILDETDQANVSNSSSRLADGSTKMDEAKSLGRLFVEELPQEIEHTLNPQVAAKKAAAFATGTVKGTISGVKGLADLGVMAAEGTAGAVDLALETAARGAGYKDGGIFGNDASQAFQEGVSGVVSTYDQKGVTGLVSAAGQKFQDGVVALGGVLDKEFTKLEKSGDIDSATAEFGGKVLGELIVSDLVIVGAVSKVSGIISKGDDLARATQKAYTAVEGAADGAKAVGPVEKVAEGAKGAQNTAEATRAKNVPDNALTGQSRTPSNEPNIGSTQAPKAPEATTPAGKTPKVNENVTVTAEHGPEAKTSPARPAAPERPKKPSEMTREELQKMADETSDEGLKKAFDDMRSGKADESLGEVGEDFVTGGVESELPVGELSKELTPNQIDELFKKGANLTPEQVAQKADYLLAQRQSQKAGGNIATSGTRQAVGDVEDLTKTVALPSGQGVPGQGLKGVDDVGTKILDNAGQLADDIPTQMLGKTAGVAEDALKTERLSDAAAVAEDGIKTQRLENAGKTPESVKINTPDTAVPQDAMSPKTPEGSKAATKADEAAATKALDKTPEARGPPSEIETPKPVDRLRVLTPEERASLKPANQLDNTKPLADSGQKPKPLDEGLALELQEKNGFREDHAKRMHEFAQEKDSFLIVRDGNPDSVVHMKDADKVPKPMSSKAKTAKVGPDVGLVVDPTNPVQRGYWDKAIKEAKLKGKRAGGDYSELKKLQKARAKALESWKDYGQKMIDPKKGEYVVEEATGRVLKKVKGTDGKEALMAVHGDYDLHGVYRRTSDGNVERANFGTGESGSAGEILRRQLNDKISGTKEYVQHGAQDDWIPDPKMVPNKPPDPPATVFMPDGSPPVRLETAQEMKEFYENVMGVKWEYPSP